MFLELHLSEKNKKIMLNIDRINSILQMLEGTSIYIGEVTYRVNESYDDIAKCINEYYNV